MDFIFYLFAMLLIMDVNDAPRHNHYYLNTCKIVKEHREGLHIKCGGANLGRNRGDLGQFRAKKGKIRVPHIRPTRY